MVMEKLLKNHGTGKIVKKSWNSVFRHGISTNFALNFTKPGLILMTLRNISLVQKVCIFRLFLKNVLNAKFEQRDSHVFLLFFPLFEDRHFFVERQIYLILVVYLMNDFSLQDTSGKNLEK